MANDSDIKEKNKYEKRRDLLGRILAGGLGGALGLLNAQLSAKSQRTNLDPKTGLAQMLLGAALGAGGVTLLQKLRDYAGFPTSSIFPTFSTQPVTVEYSTRSPSVPIEIVEKNSEAYLRGFAEKCAEYNIDPVALIEYLNNN